MKLFGYVLILSLFVLGQCASDDLPLRVEPSTEIPISKKTTTPPPKPTNTTTPATSPKTTEPEPTTTSSTTSSPTTTPTTSTTSAPTTTKATTTTTEPEPTTTTTTTTTSTTTELPPTPAPTPAPIPTKPGNWTVYDDKKNVTCIIVRAIVSFNVDYPTTDNKTANATVYVPEKPEVSGDCGDGKSDQKLYVHWGAGNELLMTFAANQSTHEFALAGLTVQLSTKDFVNASSDNVTYSHVRSEFATKLHMSYYCNKVQSYNLTSSEGGKDVVGTMSVSQTHLEAFHEAQRAEFSAASDCDMPSTPDVVPIAVGISLILLVLVVLVAYLVGRRRAQARGYVSM